MQSSPRNADHAIRAIIKTPPIPVSAVIWKTITGRRIHPTVPLSFLLPAINVTIPVHGNRPLGTMTTSISRYIQASTAESGIPAPIAIPIQATTPFSVVLIVMNTTGPIWTMNMRMSAAIVTTASPATIATETGVLRHRHLNFVTMINQLPVKLAFLAIGILIAGPLSAQDSTLVREGAVSFVTAENVYVRFITAKGIFPGDTLYILEDGKQEPALVVLSISSVSTLCKALDNKSLKAGDLVIHQDFRKESPQPLSVGADAVVIAEAKVQPIAKPPPPGAEEKKAPYPVHGYMAASSWLLFGSDENNIQRMRYTVSVRSGNKKSRLSADAHISFTHRDHQWDRISSNIFNGLKINNLVVGYRITDHHRIWLGRRINPLISSAGALDGLQYEFRNGGFSIGLVAGTRPDYRDYSFNAALPQIGAYLSHELAGNKGRMQNTLAVMEQQNRGNTDRRFVYLQHVNTLVRNLWLFGSAEVELYHKKYNPEDSTLKVQNNPVLSNLYLSVRYRPGRLLTISATYSERENPIYYETYKDIVQTLLEQVTVRGLTVKTDVTVSRNLRTGIQGSYRNSQRDEKPARSIYGYLTFAKIPGINAMATASATFLETSWLQGTILSVALNRDLVPARLSAGAGYKFFRQHFSGNDSRINQHIPEVNVNWNITKSLMMSLYYEGSFDQLLNAQRLFLNVTQRF